MSETYTTLRVARSDAGVLNVVIDAPPMNLIGPELVRDLVSLLGELESDEDIRVMVLESADPEYFVPHVDLTKVAEYTAEAAKAGGPDDASLGMLWHRLSELPVVTDRQAPRPRPWRGQRAGAGVRHAVRRSGERRARPARDRVRRDAGRGGCAAPGAAAGARPGHGGHPRSGRLRCRRRPRRYGWINRALPDAELDEYVARLARRIASFPADAVRSTKQRPQRADPARRGRDPRRRPAVPAAGPLGHRRGPDGHPVRTGAADPRPARARPRPSPRVLVTSLPILKDVRESRVRLASDRRPRNGDSPTRAAVSVHGSHRPGSPAGWCDQTWVREAGFL